MITMFFIIQMLIVPAFSPLVVGVTRKVKARFQNRTGASVLQPYRDLAKLFHKDEVISRDASWVFRFAPYVVFGTTIAIAASIPVISTFTGIGGDLIGVLYLVALGTFFLALSGLDSGSAFGGFGSSREMMLAAFAEGGLLLSLFVLALLSHTTDLAHISAYMTTVPLIYALPIALAFLAFFVAMLSETARYPFDNPATHLELTMIHEAMILEYSGKRLALMEWASANKYLIFIILGVNLFFPVGIATVLSSQALIASFLFTALKVVIFACGIALLESRVAKLRIFRLPDLLFSAGILSIIAIALII